MPVRPVPKLSAVASKGTHKGTVGCPPWAVLPSFPGAAMLRSCCPGQLSAFNLNCLRSYIDLSGDDVTDVCGCRMPWPQ